MSRRREKRDCVSECVCFRCFLVVVLEMKLFISKSCKQLSFSLFILTDNNDFEFENEFN